MIANSNAAGHWWRHATHWRRTPAVAAELAAAAVADFRERSREESRILRIEAGRVPKSGRSVAIYAHYSRDGHVHPMVLRQIDCYRDLGFDLAFVTMSSVRDSAWAAVLSRTSLAIQRRSFGRDFGAWKDAMPEIRKRWPEPGEVLLVNDSVLGPIQPLGPVFERLRDLGEGMFGLTESRFGPAHLQSYCLLFRGSASVARLWRFLDGLRLTHGKWTMIRRGEYALSQSFQGAGLRVEGIYPAEAVAEAAGLDAGRMNPTHHAWRVLIEAFGFPFVKTDLLLRNPNAVPALEFWQDAVPVHSPTPIHEIEDFLSAMNPVP